jgi:hypothetical protein
MDCPRSVLLQRERFHDQIVARLRLLNVHQLVDAFVDLEKVGIGLLADFTFERLPIHAD